MNRFGRASAIAAAVGFSALVSGCVHEGMNTVVGTDGKAQMVMTETISPVIYDYAGSFGDITPAKLAKEESKSPLPGQDSVRVYTDAEGWKGIQVRCTFHSLGALDAAEMAPGNNGTGLFSSFSITQNASQWVLDAKVNVRGITDLITTESGKSKTTEPRGITRAEMAQIGIEIGVSFQLPGQIVSDNATSVNGSVMTWDLLSQVYSLHAVNTTSASVGSTTTSVPNAGTTTSTSAAVTTTTASTTG
jgi:phosphatidylinositol mannoside-binding LppM-like protein